MTMSRAWRRWIAQLMIGLLLFGQLATTAHACAVMAGEAAAAWAARPADEGMPCPDASPHDRSAALAAPDASPADTRPDAAADTPLCLSHCQSGQQSADHASGNVPPALLSALYAVPPQPVAGAGTGTSGQAPAPRAGSSPPLSILHCCLRH